MSTLLSLEYLGYKKFFSDNTVTCWELQTLPSTVLGDIYDQVLLCWPLCFFKLINGFMIILFRSHNITRENFNASIESNDNEILCKIN